MQVCSRKFVRASVLVRDCTRKSALPNLHVQARASALVQVRSCKCAHASLIVQVRSCQFCLCRYARVCSRKCARTSLLMRKSARASFLVQVCLLEFARASALTQACSCKFGRASALVHHFTRTSVLFESARASLFAQVRSCEFGFATVPEFTCAGALVQDCIYTGARTGALVQVCAVRVLMGLAGATFLVQVCALKCARTSALVRDCSRTCEFANATALERVLL